MKSLVSAEDESLLLARYFRAVSCPLGAEYTYIAHRNVNTKAAGHPSPLIYFKTSHLIIQYFCRFLAGKPLFISPCYPFSLLNGQTKPPKPY